MLTDSQEKLWTLVEEGDLIKLKWYLRKNPGLDVNFQRGRRRRTPLHLACELDQDSVLRFLLNHGADASVGDFRGDTHLHYVAEKVQRHGGADSGASFQLFNCFSLFVFSVFERFFVPLQNPCPKSQYLPNRAGVTPLDLMHRRSINPNKRKCPESARHKEESREAKKRRYDEQCDAMFHSGASSLTTKLSYSDVPWPAPNGTVHQMVSIMFHGVERSNEAKFCKALRRQQVMWHPDKLPQRCGARLEDKGRQRILDTVTALSQELNRLAQNLRT
ncbi:NF-kappa-B inhibitor-like protein 1 [Thalassophryne amazonica]|uniref:NF-kappa-B inhibitor-like protein 1 n=1 Tax=Thalassophryne amazonica TaxID=390379 RepID=UPI00147125F5|nr:NF-kappa-B inhibitor-like protein 1 [Thalassophryne amazonica]